MLKQVSRKCILILLILSHLCSCFALAATGTLNSNKGVRHQVCTALSAQAKAYYTGQYAYDSLSELDGVYAPTDSWAATQDNKLYNALQELMSSTQKTYPQYNGYYPDSLATYWQKTDAEAGSSSYLYFYTDRLSTEFDSSTKMTREHIWPKANASYYQKNGGADLHHLRPSIESVNSAKSNYTFADVVGKVSGYTTTSIDGVPVIWCHKSTATIEVRDHIKGDIARILLYVYCRWGQPNLYTNVTGSKLPAMDSDDSTNNGIRAIDNLETLLRWCKEDPVDGWEMGRNDQTENVQGNRNVFIDYPEFAWQIFGLTPPEDMVTPTNTAPTITASSNNTAYGTVSLSDNVITAKPAAGYEVSGYTVVSGQATVVQDGNVFTVTAQSDCHIRIHFVPRSTVTLTFSAADPISGYAGDAFSLPHATAPEGCEFIGWCTEKVAETASLPTYYQAGNSYIVEESIHLYALYSYSKEVEDETADYVKVTAAPADWSGDYVIVYEPAGYIFNSSLTSPNTRNNYKAVTIQNGRITAASGDAYRITIAPYSKGYSIRTTAGLYIGNSSVNSGLGASATTPYANTFTMNADGTVRITASSGTTFRYYTLSTQRKFIYTNSTSASYADICLYRKDLLRLCTFYSTELCPHTDTKEILTPATCEADGTLTVICNNCGKILGSTVVPATGHSYTYTNAGDAHMVGCKNCSYTMTQNHSFTNGPCICGATEAVKPTVDASIKIYHTLNLANDISVTFAVPKTALSAYDSYYLECTLPEYEGNRLTSTSTVQIAPVLNGSYYYFTLTGITAVRMGDMVEAVLHMTKNGAEYISNTDSYSVTTYAYAMLGSSTDSKMLTLCADLLRYGAEAQRFKGYRTDSLVDANMTEAQKAYLSDTNALTFTATDSFLGDLTDPTVTWVGKTLDLGSKVGMKFVFNAKSYNGDISKLTMKVSYQGSNGEAKTVTLTNPAVYSAASKYYSFTFYGLLASELRTVVDVAIFEGETQLSETLRYSAESYASKNTTGALATLCKALFAYSDSAKTFFAK